MLRSDGHLTPREGVLIYNHSLSIPYFPDYKMRIFSIGGLFLRLTLRSDLYMTKLWTYAPTSH